MSWEKQFKKSLNKWKGNTASTFEVLEDYITKPVSENIKHSFAANAFGFKSDSKNDKEDKQLAQMVRIFLNTYLNQELDQFFLGPKDPANLIHLVDSPIEAALLMSIIISARENDADFVKIIDSSKNSHFANKSINYISSNAISLNNSLLIEPQKQIGEFRVDFLITYAGAEKDSTGWFKIIEDDKGNKTHKIVEKKLIVECDGHDYHEKTKQQASKDKKRDRILKSVGYDVFRYTGSDIYQDSMECAEEVIKFIIGGSWVDNFSDE